MTANSQSATENRIFFRLVWIVFLLSSTGFFFFLIAYFVVPQFSYTGMDGLAGTDYVTYYLGPLVDEALGMDGSVFALGDFRREIAEGRAKIAHPNPTYANWASRSPEGFISTPFTLLVFRHTLSRLPFWLSLNLWVLLDIVMLVAIAWWASWQALNLSKVPRKSWKAWQMFAVALMVFGFAPSLVSIGLGQINPLVLLLTAFALFAFLFLIEPLQPSLSSKAYRQMYWFLGPICLGLAINLKILPGIFLPYIFVIGLWQMVRGVRNHAVPSTLRKRHSNPAIVFACLSLLWTLLVAVGTFIADGPQYSLDWMFMALPRAMQSRAVIAPADLPDLETYLSFLAKAGAIGSVSAQVCNYVLAAPMAVLAIDISRMASNVNSADPDLTNLRLWLGGMFWLLAMFSWTFMRCHYLIIALLVFPPLLISIQRVPSRPYRRLLIVLIVMGYLGFSHPIPLILRSGGIPNYVAPDLFPLNGYNLLLGYPATLLLAVAIWIAIKKMGPLST